MQNTLQLDTLHSLTLPFVLIDAHEYEVNESEPAIARFLLIIPTESRQGLMYP